MKKISTLTCPSGSVVQRHSSPMSKSQQGLSSSLGSSTTIMAKVKEVDWKKFRPRRAGVIVYTVYKGRFLFCLATDQKTSELTDFGGGVAYRRDKTAVHGALREFSEESLGVFGDFSPEQLGECLVVYNNYMAIIFIPLICDPGEITKTFVSRYAGEAFPEVSSLAWLSRESFLTTLYLKKGAFYRRVSELLQPIFLRILPLF